jgi:hypothetical protein
LHEEGIFFPKVFTGGAAWMAGTSPAMTASDVIGRNQNDLAQASV